MQTLYTVGYQGHSIESFLALLVSHEISHVLDVRQLPISRKPGFAKNRLRQHLAEVGIAYTHLVELGTPRHLRDEVRETKDYATFFAQMEAEISAQPQALDAALAAARQSRCVLLCFEANPAECHRTVVAHALQRHTSDLLTIVDL
ncbi:MAG: DUF488 domain-containing protein [Chloroflexaceae bacterium]|jgi:uncharacterized protein (DUF488 family)|nr:DUF488 domain-containing protein [Chloroflexaceae bacterium]